MSSSQKKKLRNEQNAAQLTEKQIEEQKEAKKLRTYTRIFTAAIALMLCVVVVTTIVESGLIQRNTTVATAGDQQIKAPELNYFFVDSLNDFQNQWGQYVVLSGLTPNVPLDEQIYDEESGKTWADYFLDTAADKMKHAYGLYTAALAEGYTMDEEATAEVDSMLNSLEMDAMMRYGVKDLNAYVKAFYGVGCNAKTFRAYIEMQYIANEYARDHLSTLTYTDEQIRAKDAENPIMFNAYSYNQFYLAASNYLLGGTEGEDGKISYSEEEKAAAAVKAEQVAKDLVSQNITTPLLLDKAIADLELVTDGEAPKSTENKDVMFDQLPSNFSEWLTAPERKPGDLTMIANESTLLNEEGEEVTVVNGYYLVMFNGINENTYHMSNVRHILAKFEGGTQDENGVVTYTDEEKAAAKAEAEGILAQFQAGEATEESFAALATEKTDDTASAATGGLIENILPSSMLVENFLNWSIDDARKAGDTAIIETEYGYHVMYYVGDSELTYRDTMVKNVLMTDDMNAWEDALADKITIDLTNTKYVPTDLVLQAQ